MMEDGVDASREEGGSRGLEVADENEHYTRESAEAVNCFVLEAEDRSEVLEENEVFEEAREAPMHLHPDSNDDPPSGVEGEPEEYIDCIDLQVHDNTKYDDEENDCQRHGEVKEEEIDVLDKFDEATDVHNFDQDIGKQVSVATEERIISCYEVDRAHGEEGYKEEPVTITSNSVDVENELGGATGGVKFGSSIFVDEIKTIIEDGGRKTSSKKYENEELMESDGPGDALHEDSENQESIEETSVRLGLGNVTESIEWITDQNGRKLIKDASIQPVVLPELSAKYSEENSNGKLDKCLGATNGHASEGKENICISTNKQGTESTVDNDDQSSYSHISEASDDYAEELKADMQQTANKLQKEHVANLSCSSSEISEEIKSYIPTESSSASSAAKSPGTGSSSRPAGLGSSAPLLEPSSRALQQNKTSGSASSRVVRSSDEPTNDDDEENDEIREKLQMIRVKFLRLAHRLGQTPHNVVVAQVLYRLGLAEQLKRNTNRQGVFSFDRASVVAEQLEAAGQESLDFSCTIMVIGKTGVGKSATINSILDDVKLPTDAFHLGTKKVQEVVGKVQGINVRFIDTPGLVSPSLDQHHNDKILRSVKKFINKAPPDIVLYFDRLDLQSRDYGDASLLQTITNTFGASIWFNAIVVLTHAASAPPEGPNGSPLSYEMFINQRSHVVQQAIRQAAGDVRLMNPVSLVENHSACRMNRAGQRVLPNGQVWKPQLLLLSFASKILAEANMLLKLQDSPPTMTFGSRSRAAPLPFLLSSLLQSRPQLKLPEEQFGGDDNLDEDLDATDSDVDSDYDELPPFKPLTKAQIAKLSRSQKKAYFEELEYREKLLYKKQLKDEKKRRKLAKKMADMAKDTPLDPNNEDVGEENNSLASVSVPMPDYVLPNSFDSDNPTHRYRFLDSSNQWLVRPVLDSQGWDHDIGYEGLNVERVFVIKDKVPLSVSGNLTKDKKECALQMELASLIKHSETKASSLCLDMQTVGKDIAYTMRGEARFRNFRCNSTAAGISSTILGDSTSAGLKFEDKLTITKRLRILMSGGAMAGRGDVAYGGRLEATLRDKDYPIEQALSTIALSIMDWHGDLALGCNIQSQLSLGRGTKLTSHASLNNKGTGQLSIRLNSSEHLLIALLAIIPIVRNVKRIMFGSSESM